MTVHCSKCGMVLYPDKNWAQANRLKRDYICRDCRRKRRWEHRSAEAKVKSLAKLESWRDNPNNLEKRRKGARKRYWKKRDDLLVKSRMYYSDPINKQRHIERNRARRQKIKIEVLSHYGGMPPKCANPFGLHLTKDPFLNDIRSLSLDHINGNGNQQRKQLGADSIYVWLIKNNFPEGYQVLCMNCQWIKRVKNNEFGNLHQTFDGKQP